MNMTYKLTEADNRYYADLRKDAYLHLDIRIEWGSKKEVRDRWAAVMTELGITHRISDPTSAHGHAAARKMSDILGDDEATEFVTYSTYGIWVETHIADAWIKAQTDCKVLSKEDRPAFRRAALAHARSRGAQPHGWKPMAHELRS